MTLRKLVVALLLLINHVVWAYSPLKYSFYSSGVMVMPSDNKNYYGDIIIPSTVTLNGKKYNVVAISGGAFQECTKLKSIVIPETVEMIEAYAFADCTSLESVKMEHGSATMGYNVFENCLNLKGVNLLGVTTIGKTCFLGCDKIKEFQINVASVENLGTILTKLQKVVLGEGVETVEAKLFSQCDSIKEIELYCENVNSWFKGKASISHAVLGEKVLNIEKNAFAGCNHLKRLQMKGTNPRVYGREFAADYLEVPYGYACYFAASDYWNSIDTICSVYEGKRYYPAFVNEGDGLQINGQDNFMEDLPEDDDLAITITGDPHYGEVYCGEEDITEYFMNHDVWHQQVTPLHAQNNFSYYDYSSNPLDLELSQAGELVNLIDLNEVTNITYLKIKGQINGTDVRVINRMTKLKAVDLSETYIVAGGVTYYDNYSTTDNAINDYFFNGNKGLVHIILPKTLETIGNNAFYGLSSLRKVNIHSGLRSIGSKAFMSCGKLSVIKIPNSVRYIGEAAFSICSSMKSIIIPSQIEEISANTFMGCTHLSSIDIPSSIKYIGASAFGRCNNLIVVKIHDLSAWCKISFSEVSSNPLNNAGNLMLDNEMITKLIIPKDITSIKNFTFEGWTGLASLVIPEHVNSLADKAFQNCTYLDSVCIESKAMTLSTTTFQGCNNIRYVALNSSVIGNWFASSASSIQRIVFGKNVQQMEDKAFQQYDALTDIYSYNPNPPQIGAATFSTETTSSANLHLARGCKTYYWLDNYWSKFKSITEDLEVSYSIIYMIGDSEYYSESYLYGEEIMPKDLPTKEGYTFSGWSEIPVTMPAHDVLVTGSFAVNSYTLTYKVDGEVYKTATVAYGTELTAEAGPAKEGYTFSGWSDIPATMPAEDLVITGSFSLNSYTLTYKVDGEEYKTVTVAYGTELTAEAEPTIEGYTFSGWSEIPSTMPAHDVVVTGSFMVNSYSVIFQYGDIVLKTAKVEYGAVIPLPQSLDSDRYTLVEWLNVPATMPAYDITIYADFTDGIKAIQGNTLDAENYQLNGMKRNDLYRGLNILRMNDGTTKKVLVK